MNPPETVDAKALAAWKRITGNDHDHWNRHDQRAGFVLGFMEAQAESAAKEARIAELEMRIVFLESSLLALSVTEWTPGTASVAAQEMRNDARAALAGAGAQDQAGGADAD